MKLRINKYDVDSNIDNVSFDYALKDYKHYGKRNATYSKAIKITRSAITDRVFQGIGDVNQINGFDMGKKYYAEIHEDGITVLRGYIKIEEVSQDSISAVFYSNNISVISTIGDKLISGNSNPNDDVIFPDDLYKHTETDSLIKQWITNKDFTPNGLGYLYPYIDYVGDIKSRADIEFADFILPAVGAYQIFDKIMEQEGFTYELSPMLDYYIKQLYIPHNNGIKYTLNSWDAVNVRLGNPYKLRNVLWNDPAGNATEPIDYVPESAVIKGFHRDGSLFDKYSPSQNWFGSDNDQNYIPIIANGVYDVSLSVVTGVEPARDFNSIREDSTVTYVLSIVNDGECFDYVFGDVSVCQLRYTTMPDPSFPYSFDPDLAIWNTTFPFGSKYYDARDTKWSQFSIKGLNIKKGSKLYFRVTPDGSSNYNFDSSAGTWTYASASRYPSILPRYEASTNITITKTDTALGSEWNLNSMLPINWKQKDFVNDIFKMFNVYVETDPLNEFHLFIKTYDEFFANPKIVDWSKKIDDDKTTYKLLKNELPKSTKYLFKTDADVYSKNHEDLIGGPMYFGIENNDSEFATEEEDLTLSSGSTPMKSVFNADSANIISDSSLMEIPVLITDKEAKTDWNPRFLFPIKVYDTDASSWLWTLAPYRSLDVADPSNMFIGWTSTNTYLNKTTETGRTLYNLFYRRERNELMDDNTYIIDTQALLNNDDIAELDFSNKIWITSSLYGNAFYRVNTIKNYKNNKPCKVELIKINYTDNSFDNVINTNKINLATITTANINTNGKINTNVSVEDSSVYDPVDPTTIVNNYYIESSINYNVDGSINELYGLIEDISVGGVPNAWNGLKINDSSIGLGGSLSTDVSINVTGKEFIINSDISSGYLNYFRIDPNGAMYLGPWGFRATRIILKDGKLAVDCPGGEHYFNLDNDGFNIGGNVKMHLLHGDINELDDDDVVNIEILKYLLDASLARIDSSITELYGLIEDISVGDVSVGAWNGLTKTGNNIGLGGTLDGNAQIFIDDSSARSFIIYDSITHILLQSKGTSQSGISLRAGTSYPGQYGQIMIDKYGSITFASADPTPSQRTCDARFDADGFYYKTDASVMISRNTTNSNWLVNKAYVDNKISSGITGDVTCDGSILHFTNGLLTSIS